MDFEIFFLSKLLFFNLYFCSITVLVVVSQWDQKKSCFFSPLPGIRNARRGGKHPNWPGSAKMGADANDKVYYLIVEDGVTMTRVTAFGIESDVVHKQRSQRCHPSALHVYSWHQLVADERGYLIFFYMKYL